MNAVINFEYLVSPTLYPDIYFDKVVDNLRLLSELVSEGIYIAYLEKNIISKMHLHDYFPSDRVFQSKISKLREGSVFCSGDIVRIVNRILSNTLELDEQHIVEWEKTPIINPNFTAISPQRKKELSEQFFSLAIDSFFSENKFSPIYFHPSNPSLTQAISFSGTIKEVFPACNHALPLIFGNDLVIFSNIENIFCEMDGYEIYKVAKSELEYKFAFFVGATRLIKDNALATNIHWDDFKVGNEFIASLKNNQAFQSQQYSSVVYNIIINLLADTGVNDINPFYTSSSRIEQRESNGFLAYRVHITKAGRALRLLFWKDDYEIILSNIGNKHEEVICSP